MRNVHTNIFFVLQRCTYRHGHRHFSLLASFTHTKQALQAHHLCSACALCQPTARLQLGPVVEQSCFLNSVPCVLAPIGEQVSTVLLRASASAQSRAPGRSLGCARARCQNIKSQRPCCGSPLRNVISLFCQPRQEDRALLQDCLPFHILLLCKSPAIRPVNSANAVPSLLCASLLLQSVCLFF